MRPRVALARLLIRVGSFIQSSALMVMKPDDLGEFSRQSYARQQKVMGNKNPGPAYTCLYPYERELIGHLPELKGRLLLLGMGDGREAIPFAQMGVNVTGVDFIPELVEAAKKNANRLGLRIEGLVQNISSFEAEEGAFDFVWISTSMYSCIPTQVRRIGMLRRINKALKPDGYFICQFACGTRSFSSPGADIIRKALALVTLGNLSYETGDMLWLNREFIHSFQSVEQLHTEFAAGGFKVVHLNYSQDNFSGGAILRKLDK